MMLSEYETVFMFTDEQLWDEIWTNAWLTETIQNLETSIKRKDFTIKDMTNVKMLLDKAEWKLKDLKWNIVTKDSEA